MPEYTEIDESIHDNRIQEMASLEKTTPQGTQFDGVLNGHEHRDISVRSVTTWMWTLFSFVVIMSMGLAWLFFGILHAHERTDTIPSANFVSSIIPAPMSRGARMTQDIEADHYLPTPTQTPTLMPDPHLPMLDLRKQENKEINSYGYIHNAQGKKVGLHIPVDDAMTFALQKGFPVMADPSSLRPPAPTSPALNPAEDKGF